MAYEDKIRRSDPRESKYEEIVKPLGPACPQPNIPIPPSGLPWEGYYYSAYGIATKHGFNGTEEEWLATLVGPSGPSGPSGPIGPQGPPGIMVNQNTGDEILMWVGTIDEYNAITPQHNVLYFLKEPL